MPATSFSSTYRAGAEYLTDQARTRVAAVGGELPTRADVLKIVGWNAIEHSSARGASIAGKRCTMQGASR